MRVAWITMPIFALLAVVGCTAASDPGAASSPPSTSAATTSYPDWPTYHGDAQRGGREATMPAVKSLRVLASIKLDGQVYASPIVVGGVTIVATENDTVYAFDSAYHQLWAHHLGSPSPSSERPCGNIDPLGITGTPVYDPTHKVVYVAPEFGAPVRHKLYALRIASGATAWTASLDLPGVDPAAMQERGALNTVGNRVLVPFGGLAGDCGEYKGRVVGVSRDGSGSTVSYTVPTTREAGIWTPPGPVVTPLGSTFVSVGNGESGVGDPYDHSDSILKLTSDLKLFDSFSPTTWPTDNDSDLDLGSQGPAVVGNYIFSAGKSGTAYTLVKSHLGGIGGQVSQAKICTSFGGTSVVGSVVYVPCTDGVRAVIVDSKGAMHVQWHASSGTTGSPVLGAGRVWTLDTGAGVLHSLSVTNGVSLAQISVGSVSRFATPALHGPDVLVPTLTGLTVVRTS